MYKTETHLHLSEVSGCAKIKAAEMMQLYYEAGYKTVFVSDHFSPFYFEQFGDIPWHEKTAIFLSGYYKAREAGKKLGMNVLLSAEFNFRENPNHYLAYGITKEFLDMYPDICEKNVQELSRITRKHNIFVIQAHPYRGGLCFPTPEYIDGVEVYNSNPRHEDYNDKAENFAREYGLCMTCGSDAHRVEDVGGSAVISAYEIKTTEDYIDLLKRGEAKLYRGSDFCDLSVK